MEVASLLSGEELTALVRETGLKDRPDLRPYHTSEITLRLLEIETLSPLAKYVLEENLVKVGKVRLALLAQGIDILRLPGRVEVMSGSELTFVGPPIIEEWPNEGRLIVDGLHRIWLARQYGIKDVSCLFIRNVSMPLVPLPVSWDEIQEYPPGHLPTEKHAYRFESFSDVALVDRAGEWGVTEQNFRYFFFRDFAQLGSSGVRQFPKAGEQEKKD